jgi:hypothetical protein
MEIDATTLNQFLAALTVLILAVIAWLSKQRTDSAAITAAATTQTAATNAAMAAATAPAATAAAPARVATTIGDDHTPGVDIVTNPILLGDQAVVQIGATTYHPVYHMSAQTRRAIEGQQTPADLATVDAQIAAAEAQRGGLGIPHYVITYSRGFYEVNYGIVDAGSDTYYASSIINSSHDQTWDPAKALADAQASRLAALKAAADKAAAAYAASVANCHGTTT